jgi:hypothetical protein
MRTEDGSKSQSVRGPDIEESRITTPGGDFVLTVRLADSDRIGCLVDGLTITSATGRRLPLDVSALARTLAYVEGGLSIVELERLGKRAILRSTIPETGGGLIRFTEVVIDPASGLDLGRYVYNEATGERRRVPAAMTRETLIRLSEDLTRLLAA